ncbi:MAG: AAA family ATPase [Geminicoccaceae bacterium]
MSVSELRIDGYRSLQGLKLEMGRITLIRGANGVGKSNLYRALSLLGAAGAGRLAQAIAAEGGMTSLLWAGARKKGAVRVGLGVDLDDWRYDLALGLPGPTEGALPLDPRVKDETLSLVLRGGRAAELLKRDGPSAWLRDDEGRRLAYERVLMTSESALAQIQDARAFPEITMVARRLADWRFYHDLPTGPGAPARMPQVAVAAPSLTDDGGNLAAVYETLRVIGDPHDFDEAFEDAFPGQRLVVVEEGTRLSLAIERPGLFRPLGVAELSDGTLRYLGLLGALLGHKPAELIVLNEPETSLYGDLVEALARLVGRAAARSQLVVVTHSESLDRAVCAVAESDDVDLKRYWMEMENGLSRVMPL